MMKMKMDNIPKKEMPQKRNKELYMRDVSISQDLYALPPESPRDVWIKYEIASGLEITVRRDIEEKQKRKLRVLREQRNNGRVNDILGEVESVAQTKENLVPVLVEAVKNYATLGEISNVFRKVFGEHSEVEF